MDATLTEIALEKQSGNCEKHTVLDTDEVLESLNCTNENNNENQELKESYFLDENYKLEEEQQENNKLKYEFDAYIDGNDKIIKKYNLRTKLKLLNKNLNEEGLLGQKTAKIKRLREKLVNEIPEFKCDLCSDIFRCKTSLTCHKHRIHRGSNVFTCYYCQKVFKTNQELLLHKPIHNSDECFVCDICKKAFSKVAEFMKHTYNHGKPPYKCKECLFTTDCAKSVKAHILTHFSNKCNICNQDVTKKAMRSHLLQHTTRIECGECGKICNNKSYLDYHMVSHTGVKTKQCLYCGKGFAAAGQLEVHTRIHRKERLFECNICFKKFVQSSDRKRHMNSHNEKRYECDYCGKKFLHKESIKFHIRLHTNYKPFKCPQCLKFFPTSTSLINHKCFRQKVKCEVCNRVVTNMKKHNKSLLHRNNMFRKVNSST